MSEIQEMKYAFDRDRVRRHGYKVFKPTPIIIVECELCGEPFEKTSPRQVYHPGCREIMRAEQNRRNQRRRYGDGLHWRQVEKEELGDPVLVNESWQYLAFDIAEQAFREHDYFWLAEFGMEFLAFSGNPLNQRKFDGLMEEMVNAQESKQTQEDN